MLKLGDDASLTEEVFRDGIANAKAVYLVNGAPERLLDETAKQALEAVDFLVVQDIFESDVAQLADVVLPGVTFAEKDGTFTNAKGWVQRIHRASIHPERHELIGKLSSN